MTFQENRNIPSSHPGHGQGPAGASLSDLLTAVKNVAVNIANLQQTLLQIMGATTAGGVALTQATLVKQGPGRVAMVTVTAAPGGSPPTTQGYLVDSNSAGATGPVIYVIPGTVGSYTISLPFSLGLVVVPGTGMVVTVSYS